MSEDNSKIGRGGTSAVIEANGQKIHIQNTPAGPRATINDGPTSYSVDPAELGIKNISSSTVGGGLPRITIEGEDGSVTDLTARADRSVSKVVHEGPASRAET